MTNEQLHRLAERIAREEGLSHAEACRRLAHRPRRRPNYGQLRADRGAFAHLEQPAIRFWWQERDE